MVLAIPGSLRRDSINAAALRAAANAAARDGLAVVIDDSPRALPHFNPDLEPFPPEVVRRFREVCADAGGVLLAVPEYTFGIPGAFKNALDWTVGSGSLYRKPITVLDVAPAGRGDYVREALAHVLRAHNAHVTHHHVPITQRDRDATARSAIHGSLNSYELSWPNSRSVRARTQPEEGRPCKQAGTSRPASRSWRNRVGS